MEILKEVTDWSADYRQPNHTYLISGSGKIIAYAPWHGSEVIVVKTEMKIDKRYRKFVKVMHPGLSKVSRNEKTDPDARKFNVKSNDKEYTVIVKDRNYTCTCTGFSFRGKCKHISAVAEKLQSA